MRRAEDALSWVFSGAAVAGQGGLMPRSAWSAARRRSFVDAEVLDHSDGEVELFGEVPVGPSQAGVVGLDDQGDRSRLEPCLHLRPTGALTGLGG